MPSFFLTKWFLIATTAFFLILSAGIGTWYYLAKSPWDKLLSEVFEKTALNETSTQYAETEITLSDRRVHVAGTYFLGLSGYYAFNSTTTLTIPEEGHAQPYIFTHQSISIDDDIYTFVQTENDALKLSIPTMTNWRRFKKDAVPEGFKDIAVSGPILDNLSPFRENGTFLTLVEKKEAAEWKNESFVQYTFKLSPNAFKEKGALGMIAERVGVNGVIKAWIDEASAEIRHVRFESPPYFSTTTIVNTNTPLSIHPPPHYSD